MSFTTGNLSDAATPAQSFMTLLDTAIDGHAAWEFVEQISDGTYFLRVYRCLGTLNSFGTNFYIGIFRTANAATTVSFTVFETWDTTTKLAGGIAPAFSATTGTGSFNAPAANGSWPGAAQNPATSTLMNFQAVNTPVTTVPYWISVTNDRVVVCTQNGDQGFVYAGLFEPFSANYTEPFPLVLVTGAVARSGQSGSTNPVNAGAYTRMPINAGSQRQNWIVTAMVFTTGLDFFNGEMSGVEAGTGRYLMSRAVLGNAYAAGTILRHFRGFLKDMLMVHQTVTLGANGLTVADGGIDWVKVGFLANPQFSNWFVNPAA